MKMMWQQLASSSIDGHCIVFFLHRGRKKIFPLRERSTLIMWRLKGGVGNGKEFDTHANCLGAGFFFTGEIRIAREFAHCFDLTIGQC